MVNDKWLMINEEKSAEAAWELANAESAGAVATWALASDVATWALASDAWRMTNGGRIEAWDAVREAERNE